MGLVVKALRLNTLSKLTAADCIRFEHLVSDMFPGVVAEEAGHHWLADALRQSCIDLHLTHNSRQVILT